MIRILLFLLFSVSLTTYSQNLDIDLLRNINHNRNEGLDDTFSAISATARPFAISVPVLVYGIGLINNNKTLREKGLTMGASFIVASGISTTLKYAFNKPRPYITYPDIEKVSVGGSPSFPSGHTSDAFSNATSLSLAFPKWYVIVPSYTYATAVGYSRIHLGVHYPSDVIVGAIIGTGSAFLCYRAQKWLNNSKRRRSRALLTR